MTMTRISTLARITLVAIFICSLLFSAWNVWKILGSAAGRLVVPYAQEVLIERLTEVAFSEVDQSVLEGEITTQLQSEPRDWVLIESLNAISDERNFNLSAEMAEEIQNAYDEDHSFLQSSADCAKCVWDSASCEISTAMFCGIAVSMTPIGDIAGVSRAGVNYWKGTEVDKVDAALSVIGLGATSLTFVTAGSSLSVKVGAGFLKFANRSGNLPAPLRRSLTEAAATGVKWGQLRHVRTADDLKNVVRMRKVRPMMEAAASIGTIVDRTGTKQGMYLLKLSGDAAGLRPIAAASVAWGNQTAGYVKILGSSRIAKAALRYADEVYGLIVGVFGLLFSIINLLFTAAGRQLLRKLRRLSKRRSKT